MTERKQGHSPLRGRPLDDDGNIELTVSAPEREPAPRPQCEFIYHNGHGTPQDRCDNRAEKGDIACKLHQHAAASSPAARPQASLDEAFDEYAEPAARTEQPTPRKMIDTTPNHHPVHYENKYCPDYKCVSYPETPYAPAAPVAVVEPRREIELIPTIWETFRVVVGDIYVCEDRAEAEAIYKKLVEANSQRKEGAGQK